VSRLCVSVRPVHDADDRRSTEIAGLDDDGVQFGSVPQVLDFSEVASLLRTGQ